MSVLFSERVIETTTTSGTGDYSLGGSPIGGRTFVEAFGSGKSVPYRVQNADNSIWEERYGEITDGSPDTLARGTFLRSSTGSTINWPDSSTKYIFNGPQATVLDQLLKGAYDGSRFERICFSGHKNGADQTGIVSATYTKITFGTEDFDLGGHYDSENSKFLPTVAGKYRLTAAVRFSAGVIDQAQYIVAIYKNGSVLRLAGTSASGTNSFSVSVSAVVDANGSTDYFEIYANGGGVGDKTISGLAANSYFCGEAI